MTLLFIDGFDAQDLLTKWSASVSLLPNWSTFTARFGTGSCVTATNSTGTSILSQAVTPSSKLFVGFAYVTPTPAAATLVSFWGDSGATEHTRITTTAAGAIAITRAGTVLATSAAGVITTNTWAFIEVSATVADAGGVVDVRVNGVSVVNFTGDTKNAGTSTNMDVVTLNLRASSAMAIDDLYILNDQGSVNNTFLGDVRVQTLQPNGAGSQADLTPVGSANNWQNVDELPVNASDYNYSSTAGHRDLYALDALLGGTTSVHGVQVNAVARKTDSGARSLKTLVKSGATVTASSALPLTALTDTYSVCHNVNPTTAAAWAVGDIAALEAGVEVV